MGRPAQQVRRAASTSSARSGPPQSAEEAGVARLVAVRRQMRLGEAAIERLAQQVRRTASAFLAIPGPPRSAKAVGVARPVAATAGRGEWPGWRASWQIALQQTSRRAAGWLLWSARRSLVSTVSARSCSALCARWAVTRSPPGGRRPNSQRRKSEMLIGFAKPRGQRSCLCDMHSCCRKHRLNWRV